jgi:hypothetical protein
LGRCKVLKATALALLVRRLEAVGTESGEYWIPKRQLVEGNECVKMGDVGLCFATLEWRESVKCKAEARQMLVRRLPYMGPGGGRLSVRPRRARSMKGRMG